MVAAIVYTVWRQRNRKFWSKIDINREEAIKRVKFDVTNRAMISGVKCIPAEDICWFIELK